MADKLDALEQQLEMFIENTRQLGILVNDFQPQSQNVLHQKLNTLVTGMQELDKMKADMQSFHVPLEVFEYIDHGKNPNLYTKDCLEKALAKNEQVKGKIDNLKKFKVLLIAELSKAFPNETAKYRALRSDERPT